VTLVIILMIDDNFVTWLMYYWPRGDCVQFQRAFGKRGPKGEVRVINVHLDDVLSDIDVTKNLPNDAEPMMSHSKKHNKDMPSSQQKRKHQISFLAFKVCLSAAVSPTYLCTWSFL